MKSQMHPPCHVQKKKKTVSTHSSESSGPSVLSTASPTGFPESCPVKHDMDVRFQAEHSRAIYSLPFDHWRVSVLSAINYKKMLSDEV